MNRLPGRNPSLSVAFVLLLAALLAACSGGASPAPTATPQPTATASTAPTATPTQRQIRVSAVFYSKAIAYFQDMISGMQDRGKELGVTLDLNYANFNVTEEYNLLQNAITTKPDALLLAPLDPAAFVPLVKEAWEAGIPLVTVGDDVAEEGRAYELAFVGPSFKEMGARKAQWTADALNGTGTVVVIHGPRGIDFVEGQKVGYEEVFAKYPNITVIEGPYGNISSDVGLASTENMLTANPNISAIMYDSEDLAVGGIRALQERQIAPGTILMVASDGTKAGIDAVRNGTLDVTVSENAYVNGRLAIQVIYDAVVNGTQPAKWVPIELITITKDNVDSLPPDILPPGQ